MSRALIIGYGNPLRGDDGIGWSAACTLADRLTTSTSIQVIPSHQLTPELSVALAQSERVLFLDAAQGDEPGAMTIRKLVPGKDATPPALDHTMTPEKLLALTQSLYGKCPRATLVTVTGHSFEVGETFSDAVSRTFPELCAWVEIWAAGPQGTISHA